jgi:hypothetical protein
MYLEYLWCFLNGSLLGIMNPRGYQGSTVILSFYNSLILSGERLKGRASGEVGEVNTDPAKWQWLVRGSGGSLGNSAFWGSLGPSVQKQGPCALSVRSRTNAASPRPWPVGCILREWRKERLHGGVGSSTTLARHWLWHFIRDAAHRRGDKGALKVNKVLLMCPG